MAIEQKKLGEPTGETLLGKTVSVDFPGLFKYVHFFFLAELFLSKVSQIYIIAIIISCFFLLVFSLFMFANVGQCQ